MHPPGMTVKLTSLSALTTPKDSADAAHFQKRLAGDFRLTVRSCSRRTDWLHSSLASLQICSAIALNEKTTPSTSRPGPSRKAGDLGQWHAERLRAYPPIRPKPHIDLVFLVVTAIDQNLLPVRLVDDHRLEQIGRHDLDAIVIGLGVVDFRLLAGSSAHRPYRP